MSRIRRIFHLEDQRISDLKEQSDSLAADWDKAKTTTDRALKKERKLGVESSQAKNGIIADYERAEQVLRRRKR